MGKYSLIIVGGFALVFARVQANINAINLDFTDLLTVEYSQATARSAAQSAIQMSLATLVDSTTWRGGLANISLMEATAHSSLIDSDTDTTLTPAQVQIAGVGQSGSAQDTMLVTVVVPFLPDNIRGAITANSDVRTLGNLVVDGRDHDLSANLIGQSGTLGISSAQDLSQSGSSQIGGTASFGVDYAPQAPANPNVVETFAGAVPTDPDAFFDYDPGTLKGIAQSGAYGSQYVTDPSGLTLPLAGVTYVELAAGGIWKDLDFGASSGLLIVHNSSTDALLKNINSGSFEGIILADDIIHIHTTIIGAVVSLTASPSGNCIGNGSGQVLYSKAAISKAASLSGGGDGGVTLTGWWE